MVLARDQLHLVELKYYSGVLTGDDHRWLRPGKRAEDSPLKLARRKAQYLASRLQDAARQWERETNVKIPDMKQVVPFVQESVFLHHQQFRSELDDHSAQGMYGLDGAKGTSRLPGISELLLEPPRNHRTITLTHDRLLPEIMKRLGLVPRRERVAGSWVIEEALVSEGASWQDWRAYHQVSQTQHARIRFRTLPDGASETAQKELRRLAQHEFSTMGRLVHDGLLRPLDIVESDLGTGLVYPLEKSLQRLDLWLAEQTQGLSLDTQLNLIRQIAEAVHYAHGSAVTHRDLTPDAIWVRSHSDDSIKVLVGDWHSAGIAGSSRPTDLPADGVTALHRSGEIDLGPTEQATYAAYRAPEDIWQTSSTDRFRLDVFSIGALAFYILTGDAPATTGAALRDRLRQQSGLDISPELPAASEPLRALVLNATKPAPTERTPDLATFLEQLAQAERTPDTSAEPDLDPLEARPGTVLDSRFRLERRLGQGSTAVGLLVTDLSTSGEPERVLKVALDDNAARRLTDEAEVLRRLDSPRLVRLLDGPIALSGRQALLLEVAGTQTLAEVLRERTRMSLDPLQRYGTDLLEALAALDKAGVDHRDIKPANLGVRVSKSGDRAKHLVLFDFSLTRAAASATEAGTPPYLDPFLATDARPRYDSPAERYAASVVLFEMATGHTPAYGEGGAHPGSITAAASVPRSAFDKSIAKAMVAFFTKALARDAEQRHHTATEMLREWESAFPSSVTTVPDNADELATAAGLETPLGKAGLSARALSAIEPLNVQTVGDLVALDAVRLNQFSGAADVTRREVKGRAKRWRTRFADTVREPSTSANSVLPSPQDAAQMLMAHTGKGRSTSRRETARLLFGVGTELDAFATQAQLGAHLTTPVGAARITQLLSALQDGWADHSGTLALLIKLDQLVHDRLDELGCVATVDELTQTLLAAMTPRGLSTREAEREEHRLVLGLLRVVLDRQRALLRADAEVEPLHTRRREGRMSLIATDPALLETAEALGREADRLVAADTGTQHELVIPADLVAERLSPIVGQLDTPPAGLDDDGRRARIAAAVSTRASASGAGELHHRDLPISYAVALALRGVAAHQQLTPRAVQQRVGARFPALTGLPDRPELDEVISSANVGLVYASDKRVYRSVASAAGTTGLDRRQPTNLVVEVNPISTAGVAGQRLRDSRARRSFLALGIPGHRLERGVRVLEQQFGARTIDLTEVLLRAVREQADAAGMKWATVQAADAASSGSRPALGLATLVERAIPSVIATVQESMSEAGETDRPLLLTDAGPLARYRRLGLLAQWTDLTRKRHQAMWLVVPQLRNSHGPLLDGQPVTLNSPGQFLPLDTDWIDARDQALAENHKHVEVSP